MKQFRLLTGQWVPKSVEVSTGPAEALFVPDPELLDIGDNVIFGSLSHLIKTDGLGGKIVIEAMLQIE